MAPSLQALAGCTPRGLTTAPRQRCRSLLVRAAPEQGRPAATTSEATQAGNDSSSTALPAASAAAAPAAAPAQPQPGGLFASAQSQQLGFTALSAASLAFGAAALASPQLLLSLALGLDATPLDAAFCRIAGATMAVAAAVEFSLADAVRTGHLKSPTYQKLLVAVIAKNVLYLAAFAQSLELWTPQLLALFPSAALVSLAAALPTLQAGFAAAGARSPADGLAVLVQPSAPKTAAGWAYLVCVLLYLATVAACYAPEVMYTGQAMTPAAGLLKHIWAPGFLLAGAACWVLQDAADRGRLGASTFVRLNQGLAALEAVFAGTMATAMAGGLAASDGAALSNLAGSVAIAAFCGWQAVSAKK